MAVEVVSQTQPYLNIINLVAASVDIESATSTIPLAYYGVLIPLTVFLAHIPGGSKEEGRSLGKEQALVYEELAIKVMEQLGVDGRSCVLRFLCELQKRPIARWSIAGRLLTFLFTPDDTDDNDGKAMLSDYVRARTVGGEGDQACVTHYSTCSFSVFNYFESFSNTTSTPPCGS